MDYKLMVKRRLGLLEDCTNRNIITSNTSLRGGEQSVGVFYTMVVDYATFDFLFFPEWRNISANEAYEIRKMLVDFIETNYKDKIINSYNT